MLLSSADPGRSSRAPFFVQAAEARLWTIAFGPAVPAPPPIVGIGGWIGSWELWAGPFSVLSRHRRAFVRSCLPDPASADLRARGRRILDRSTPAHAIALLEAVRRTDLAPSCRGSPRRRSPSTAAAIAWRPWSTAAASPRG